jgi:hypothetical protein
MAQDTGRKKIINSKGKPALDFWLVLFISTGILLVVGLVGFVSLQPLPPGFFSRIFVLILVFLGMGLLAAAAISRYLDQHHSDLFPED